MYSKLEPIIYWVLGFWISGSEYIFLFRDSFQSLKNIIKIAKVENAIYFQELYKGVFVIENGNPKLISDNSIVKENKLVDIFLKNNINLKLFDPIFYQILNSFIITKLLKLKLSTSILTVFRLFAILISI